MSDIEPGKGQGPDPPRWSMLNLKSLEVKRLIRAAVAHLDAARELLRSSPVKSVSTRGHEVVYLSGYVVECSLKALFLSRYPIRSHEEDLARIKEQLKHNLDRLRAELNSKSVNFPKVQNESFRRIRRHWSSEMRYEFKHWKREEAERILLAAETILEWVKGE